ncbi:MerR family transcriptional regulator [Agrilactobacillus composti DSM 18527 = JCM 14202]|uniref:MerR family transcriptional regulator n=1 Tax=Agrilactobacillus composti DSM 18527 = JCM 14202 TaxID=1423734 RepID=X0PCY2_9LACO|nr:MerR family transcriptional regulator [Agrilactobacillus composti]KRM33144.1 MerR family transcriptional regulator [Agrilactobacillus composti DSM 18527 = JCM 14202]GAF38488.1 transcriptional regulator, MerR family [Agrilactobacillus composti DSM 18527 = JCM 14202]
MKTYSISTVSKMYHLPASTLRYYEELGLLYNVGRDGIRRVYTDQHLSRLSAICCFKNAGMTLKELQLLLNYESENNDLSAVIELLQAHDVRLKEQLALLLDNENHIQRKLHFYQDIAAAEKAGKPAPEWADYKTKNFIPAHDYFGPAPQPVGVEE